ncbi:tyrosine-type recombinase/integrase [Segatella copri]|uniref:tyrosine-type recombinase/integrase n=1 Tax=Segatella copri TaxID=165179 RepID=UPI00294B266C|nr:tyrosine-type recombinase/integrase [Segatella copri]
MVNNKKTIKEIADIWKEDKRQYVKQSTMAVYLLSLKNHLLPFFGGKMEVTEDEVQAFALEKLNHGLSQKSIKDMLIVLKMVVRFGEKQGWLNHVEWKVKFPANQPKATLPILTKTHQKKLMDYLKDNFTFPNLGILVCLSTGLRIGEVCALKWSDINMDTGLLHVNRTIERIYIVDSDKPHTEIVINTPKTKNSLREIPLSKELVRIFKSLMKVVNKDYYVLTNNTKPTEPRTYRNYFNKLLKQLDIPRLKFHGLRHSFATRCIESHCDYKTVSVLLGHADISTTLNLYVHPNEEQKRSCIDKMMRYMK